MSRYIDSDLLQEDFKADHGGKRSLMIDTQPTADVRENVKGIWEIDVAGQTAKCDQCHFLVYDFQARAYAFCPNCGADMRGES